jgi:heme oxygenase
MNELLSDQLKARTLAPHQELEKALVQRMRAMRSLDDYIKLLQIFYSYFGALEDRINLYVGSTQLPDHLERRKLESLVKDIQSLGGTLPEKVAAEHLPLIENHLQAFGALYVMEGSTLGGKIISQMISKQLGIHNNGLLFFQSYGEQLNSMWDNFKLTLNRQADTEADCETIIAAADATFKQFKVVLDGVDGE